MSAIPAVEVKRLAFATFVVGAGDVFLGLRDIECEHKSQVKAAD